MKYPELKDKVAIVTGANNEMGIGASIAKALASNGVKVMLHFYRLDPEALGLKLDDVENATQPGIELYYKNVSSKPDKIIEEIIAGGGEASAFEADLADEDMFKLLFERTEECFGPVNILIHNAEVHIKDRFISKYNGLVSDEKTTLPGYISAKSIEHHFNVNVKATALLISEYVKKFIANNIRYGRIITISTNKNANYRESTSYISSKFALESYSRNAAVELGNLGITVNTVSPGYVQNGKIEISMEKEISPKIPLKRIGNVEDIANAVLFFVSPDASWITGQNLHVNGGQDLLF